MGAHVCKNIIVCISVQLNIITALCMIEMLCVIYMLPSLRYRVPMKDIEILYIYIYAFKKCCFECNIYTCQIPSQSLGYRAVSRFHTCISDIGAQPQKCCALARGSIVSGIMGQRNNSFQSQTKITLANIYKQEYVALSEPTHFCFTADGLSLGTSVLHRHVQPSCQCNLMATS